MSGTRNKSWKILRKAIGFVIVFCMLVTSFTVVFADESIQETGGSVFLSDPNNKEAVDKLVNQIINLEKYIDPNDKLVLRATKEKLISMAENDYDSLWDSVLEDPNHKLLTDQVVEKFDFDVTAAKESIKKMVNDLLKLQYLSISDSNAIIDELRNFKANNWETVQNLFNPEPNAKIITVDDFVNYAREMQNTYTDPNYIKNSKYLDEFAKGTDEILLNTIDTMILGEANNIILKYSKLNDQMNAIGWSVALLDNHMKFLREQVVDEHKKNLAKASELIILKTALRSKTELYNVDINTEALPAVQNSTIIPSNTAEANYNMTTMPEYFDVKILGQGYSSNMNAIAIPDNNKVIVELQVVGDQNTELPVEVFKVTPKEGITNGETCQIIFYRDPMDPNTQQYVGNPEKDWLMKLNVTFSVQPPVDNSIANGYIKFPFQDISKCNGGVKVEIGKTVDNSFTSQQVTTVTNDNGYFESNNIPADTYDIQISANGYLSRTINNVVVEQAQAKEVSTINNPIKLWAGDPNGDNIINNTDISILLDSISKISSEFGYNPSSNFDNDNAVNAVDLSILLYKFNFSSDNYPQYE